MTSAQVNIEGERNIEVMFRRTAVIMILTELTGILSSVIDGIIVSRFLGTEIFSGVSLLSPFTSIVLLLAGFLSTGCNILCSRLVGCGKKKEANEAFNLAFFLALLVGLLLVAACVLFPRAVMIVSGVKADKYPEVTVHLYDYLRGYMFGIPFMMLIQVMAPILVLDNGNKLFTVSSGAMCVVNIAGDLLNVFVFRGGAFGIGLASAAGFIVQMLILLPHFLRHSRFFRISIQQVRLNNLAEIAKNGSPSFVKRISGTLRDILVNYLNILVALSAAAIAARGIQNDLLKFLFCIAGGLGRTMVTMVGVYYSAYDRKGLIRLFSYSFRFGLTVTLIAGVIAFLAAPPLIGLYTEDPEVASLAVFSVRWMAAALVCDTICVLYQHYFQGIGDLKKASVLSFSERFFLPVACAFILGMLFGSRGILVSAAVGKFILVLILFIWNCVSCKGFPKRWSDLMFLPRDFGGTRSENFYDEILSREGAVEASRKSEEFCLKYGVDEKKSRYAALFVEELATNVFEHAERKGITKPVRVDLRLFTHDGKLYISLLDLSEQFDPTMFQELRADKRPEAHVGIRMVMSMATEVRYVNTFGANNLTVYLE